MTANTTRPAFQIERARNGQWTAHLVAGNGEVTWVSEQFTTLSKAEESLFHLVDEALAILADRLSDLWSMDEESLQPRPTAIRYELSVAYSRGVREYEPRIAHRAPS